MCKSEKRIHGDSLKKCIDFTLITETKRIYLLLKLINIPFICIKWNISRKFHISTLFVSSTMRP